MFKQATMCDNDGVPFVRVRYNGRWLFDCPKFLVNTLIAGYKKEKGLA